MTDTLKKKRHLSTFQIIILGFAGVIIIGALLLMLPISSRSHQVTPFNETLFTATSAVCVTGLIVQDTATYWSSFGQAVILLLIQTGGLGVVTVAASLALLSGRKISLMQRSTMQEAISAPSVVKLTGFILCGTFIVELIGALVMMPVFLKDFGYKGIWMSFFHSISAFCNAGFDLLGTPQAKFVSLTGYYDNALINTVIMLLIIVGGIGFLTWDDFCKNRFHFRRYKMQSKVVLVTSAVLIIGPAIFYYLYEFVDFPTGKRILVSLFQAVTPRTAGFNTTDLASMKGASQVVMIVLMLIGGSPGSTAGGLKTTTVAVLISNAFSVFRRKEDVNFFGRRIDPSVVRNAATVFTLYVTLLLGGAIIISISEGLPIGVCLFETASAVGTVGLTLGITTQLGVLSQCVLIMLMFLGRVGGLTIIYAAFSGTKKNLSKVPQERITVG